MKLTLHLEAWSTIELQGSPVDCAIFLQALRGELSQQPQNPVPENAPAAEPAKSSSLAASRPTTEAPGNRRQRVLAVLRGLAETGSVTVKLNQIVKHYQQSYPDEDLRHLDQVVRDLANKTDLVVSPQRGCYRLAE